MRGPYKPKNRGMLLSTYLLCSLSPASELNLHRFPRESWTFMIPNDDSVLQIEEFLIYCAKSGGIVVCVFSFPSCFALWCNYMKLCHSKGGQNSERAQTFSSKKKTGQGSPRSQKMWGKSHRHKRTKTRISTSVFEPTQVMSSHLKLPICRKCQRSITKL